jgi:adenylate kinase family enzyme
VTDPPQSTSPRRVNVRGTSGSGKTVFSAELASRLGLPHIELDALHWGPGWSEPTPEAFRATVREVLEAHPFGWVIDGGYDRKLGDMITGAADTIVWIDLPLGVVLPRLWLRTLQRVLRGDELWNGNRESWREQFASRQSIFVWAFHAHRRHRRAWTRTFAGDPRLVRLRTRADVRRWLDSQRSGS